eukprot:10603214-Alexandrium_andersonii.AAC.1
MPGLELNGIAWREDCPPPQDVAAHGVDWVLHAAGLDGQAGPAAFAACVDLSRGSGRCPLCGMGEQ